VVAPVGVVADHLLVGRHLLLDGLPAGRHRRLQRLHLLRTVAQEVQCRQATHLVQRGLHVVHQRHRRQGVVGEVAQVATELAGLHQRHGGDQPQQQQQQRKSATQALADAEVVEEAHGSGSPGRRGRG